MFGIPNIGIHINSETSNRRLTSAIISTGNALLREAGRLFKPLGISAAQFNVLTLLIDAPKGLRPSDLTHALVVDPSSTTYVLDRMEAFGWLRRVDENGDRRAWRIILTPAGRTIFAQAKPLYIEGLERAFHGLGQDQITGLTAALEEIQKAAPLAVDSVLITGQKKSTAPRRSKR